MRTSVALAALVLAATGSWAMAQPGPNYEGSLTRNAPRAEHSFDLAAGQVVTLTAYGPSGLDTVLTLRGPDGRQVAMNDDVAPGDLSSRIIYAAQRPGRYTVSVSGFSNATGDYSLDLFYGADVGLSYGSRTLQDAIASLSRRQPEVRYQVDLPAGEPFVATTVAVSEELDTTLTLISPTGETVAENDDRGDGSLNSQIVYRADQPGRYTVVVGTFGGQGAGEAVLSMAIDPNAHAPFNFDTITRSVIARYEGQIDDRTPERDYPLDLTAGQTILVMADAVDEGLDPVITLNGLDGFPVALNDDRAVGTLNSAFAFTVPTSGRYVLNMTRYSDGASSGAYVLEVSNVDAGVVDELRAQSENPVTLSGPMETIETRDFRLMYTLRGRDRTTPEYAQATAEAIQRAFDTQIHQLGWSAPVRDADGRLRAYIADAGEGTMGYMRGVEVIFDNPQTAAVRERTASRTILVIDNNLSEGRDEGEDPMRLMRATAAHEFNHMVQYGYDSEEGLQWLYESTASWIETATMGEDEDAARYAVTDFGAPQLCWTTTEDGHNYGQWTLLQSLADRHGPRIVTRLWENAATLDGLETMTATLGEVGTTLPQAAETWRIQNFARDYLMAPRIDGAVSLAGGGKRSRSSMSGQIQELGAAYHQIRAGGPQRYRLDSRGGLQMTGLGVRNGQVEVTPLGSDGVFNADGYDFAVVMIFNPAVPDQPGDCHDTRYSIEASPAQAAVNPATSRVDARHFRTPGS
ncbi:MAG: PPC domain-containing protein [Caulobacterales bacterium]|nr:PPC domain-containing protein [Caulobacterales bacterium]